MEILHFQALLYLDPRPTIWMWPPVLQALCRTMYLSLLHLRTQCPSLCPVFSSTDLGGQLCAFSILPRFWGQAGPTNSLSAAPRVCWLWFNRSRVSLFPITDSWDWASSLWRAAGGESTAPSGTSCV